jgi:hypothetical protein
MIQFLLPFCIRPDKLQPGFEADEKDHIKLQQVSRVKAVLRDSDHGWECKRKQSLIPIRSTSDKHMTQDQKMRYGITDKVYSGVSKHSTRVLEWLWRHARLKSWAVSSLTSCMNTSTLPSCLR